MKKLFSNHPVLWINISILTGLLFLLLSLSFLLQGIFSLFSQRWILLIISIIGFVLFGSIYTLIDPLYLNSERRKTAIKKGDLVKINELKSKRVELLYEYKKYKAIGLGLLFIVYLLVAISGILNLLNLWFGISMYGQTFVWVLLIVFLGTAIGINWFKENYPFCPHKHIKEYEDSTSLCEDCRKVLSAGILSTGSETKHTYRKNTSEEQKKMENQFKKSGIKLPNW